MLGTMDANTINEKVLNPASSTFQLQMKKWSPDTLNNFLRATQVVWI